jgi:ABC-type transport system substrate-binding protein
MKKGEDVLLAIAGYMNAVGFNTDIGVYESSTHIEMRATGNYDLFYLLASQNNNDPTDYLNHRVYTDAHHSNYKNEEMNKLIARLLIEMDADKRAEYVTRVSHIIREEAAPHSAITTVDQVWYADWGVTGINYFSDGSTRIMYANYDPSLVPKK